MFLWPQTAIKWPEMLQNLSKSASLKKLSSSASFCGLRVPSWTQPAGHASTRVRGSGGQKNWKKFFLPNQLKMMQNGAQTPPITIFSTFSMTSNEIWPLWHLAALLLPLHHQAVISLLPAGSLTRESGPGPWLHSKRCEICSKTCKYGVWEGFLAIWGHFQVIREKNFFFVFLTPGPLKWTILPLASRATWGLAGQHPAGNSIQKGAKACRIVFAGALAEGTTLWDLPGIKGTWFSLIWECNFHIGEISPTRSKNRPFSSKNGTKQACISLNMANCNKTKGFYVRGTYGGEN